MDRKWLPLNALRAFEAAGQHLSFTAAANSLTVAQSAVSRHVIVLENFLGVALFERRPQQLGSRRIATSSWMPFRSLITANKQVMSERRHDADSPDTTWIASTLPHPAMEQESECVETCRERL